ncbi:phosphotransferase family protein [Streptomyces sp. NPDC048111]|uniref:phosphotransferase family protein n=1 Tax=Streptomyces sp. NPDC048111 TaxID=3365500 RepID=UPI0037113AB0
MADRPDGTVVRHGGVVAKAHAEDTDAGALRTRLAVAAHPLLDGILLAPLAPPAPTPLAPDPAAAPTSLAPDPAPAPTPLAPDPAATPQPTPQPAPFGPATHDGPRPAPRHVPAARTAPTRPVTLWPYGVPIDPHDPDAAPWEAAAGLLARLHRVPPAVLPGPLPPARGPEKAARAIRRMRACAADTDPAAEPVLGAWAQLPGWARGEAPAPGPARLCHGDFHLGQLVRHPARAGAWTLIDIDDLGLGVAAWDLARPAAWFAAGLLAPDTWARFLAAYRAEGGPAVPADGDPWPQLDVPARALTVQTAALALAKCAEQGRAPDEAERMMLDSCARVCAARAELEGAPT